MNFSGKRTCCLLIESQWFGWYRMNQNIRTFCDENHGPIEFYCDICEGTICHDCFEEEHKLHSVTPYREYLQKNLKNSTKFQHMEKIAVEAEMFESLQLAHKVILEYEKRLEDLEELKKNKEELLAAETKTRKLIGGFHEIRYFAHDLNYSVDMKNVEMFLKDASTINLREKVNRSMNELEKKCGPFHFTTRFHKASSCCSGIFGSTDWQGGTFFRHEDHEFELKATPVKASEGNTRLSISLKWNYKGCKEDLKGKIFFFKGEGSTPFSEPFLFMGANKKTPSHTLETRIEWKNSYDSPSVGNVNLLCAYYQSLTMKWWLEFGYRWGQYSGYPNWRGKISYPIQILSGAFSCPVWYH